MTSSAEEPQSSYVLLGEWRAHVLRWSEGRGAPVVLLHGFTGHAHGWSHLGAALSQEHEVVAVDQRGHGRSDPTSSFGSNVLASDIGLLLDAYGWERASIVGHSMGGAAALLFAARSPHRVDRLVVIDTGPVASPEGVARIRSNVGRADTFASLEDALAEGRRSFPLADEELLKARIEENLVALPDGTLTWRTAKALRDTSAARDDASEEERWWAWRSTSAPTLLIHGVESDVLTAELAARLVAERPDVALVDIDRAGHSVPLDRPDELAAAVRRFLSGAG